MSGLTTEQKALEASTRPYRKVDAQARAKFLRAYARTGNKSASAKHAGLTVSAINRYAKRNKAFNARMQECVSVLADSLEEEAIRRGRDGYQEEVFQNGELVGFKTKYSDRLLATLLAAHIPGRYGKQVLEVQGSQGGPIQMANMNANVNLDLNDVNTAHSTELNLFAPTAHSADDVVRLLGTVRRYPISHAFKFFKVWDF